jgi:hypothetical protein
MSMEKILRNEVFEDGFREIRLGMALSQFLPAYVKVGYFYRDKSLVKIACPPTKVSYVFFESMEFYFDLNTSLLVQIDLFGAFQGKYQGIIGIGNTIGEVRAIRPDISIDDEFAMLGESWCLNFVANEDLTSLHSREKINACKIVSISIRPPRIGPTELMAWDPNVWPARD